MVGSAGELYGVRVLTVGLDLAAEPAGTALATIEWSSGRARLVGVDVGVEVYPAASLRIWGLPTAVTNAPPTCPRLAELVDRLQALAPWLEFGAHDTLCRASDHAFDAVVAALTARAAAVGLATRPGDRDLHAARTEGWIILPTSPLADLRPHIRTTQPAPSDPS